MLFAATKHLILSVVKNYLKTLQKAYCSGIMQKKIPVLFTTVKLTINDILSESMSDLSYIKRVLFGVFVFHCISF